MRINKIQNHNYSFKGYKAILANDKKGDIERISYLGMLLDNNGTPDLSRYHEVLKLKPVQDGQMSDVLTLAYARLGYDKIFVLDNSRLLLDEELMNLKELVNKKKCSMEFFQKEERFAIKAYTFLSDLTSRLMNQNIPVTGNTVEQAKVFRQGYLNMLEVIQSERCAADMMQNTVCYGVPFQQVSGLINKIIQKSMKRYFL